MSLTRRTVLTAAAAAAAAPVVVRAGTARPAGDRTALAADPVAGSRPKSALHAGHRFDLRAEAVDLFGGEVRLKQGTVHQQVAFDPVTGLAYVTQLISGGRRLADEPAAVSDSDRGRRGDLCVSEVAPDGTVRAVMYLRGVGHGGGLGVEHVDGRPWLWLETDADPVTSGFAYGSASGASRSPPTPSWTRGAARSRCSTPSRGPRARPRPWTSTTAA